jgi:hypothetical protein
MKLLRRTFQGETDHKQMSSLVHDFPEDNLHLSDLPYRFSSWALDDPRNVALWFDGSGGLQAWVVLQTPFWTFDYAYHPGEGRILFPEILAWADLRAREVGTGPYGHPTWFTNVFRDQLERIQALEAAGYDNLEREEEYPWSKVLLVNSLADPAHHSLLPDHFVLRPLAGEAEVDDYVLLHQTVFETKNMTGAWRRRVLQRPEYLPDLDIVVVAPDGRLAAFCIGWFDPQGPLGNHAVRSSHCVHPDFPQSRAGWDPDGRIAPIAGSRGTGLRRDGYLPGCGITCTGLPAFR